VFVTRVVIICLILIQTQAGQNPPRVVAQIEEEKDTTTIQDFSQFKV